jgi:hypothetical protein
MKSFVVGAIVAIITTIILVVFYDLNMAMKFTSGIGIISWLLAALLSGALNSGDRIRANFNTENQEERKTRIKITGRLLLFGVPNLCIAVVLFFILKK